MVFYTLAVFTLLFFRVACKRGSSYFTVTAIDRYVGPSFELFGPLRAQTCRSIETGCVGSEFDSAATKTIANLPRLCMRDGAAAVAGQPRVIPLCLQYSLSLLTFVSLLQVVVWLLRRKSWGVEAIKYGCTNLAVSASMRRTAYLSRNLLIG